MNIIIWILNFKHTQSKMGPYNPLPSIRDANLTDKVLIPSARL